MLSHCLNGGQHHKQAVYTGMKRTCNQEGDHVGSNQRIAHLLSSLWISAFDHRIQQVLAI